MESRVGGELLIQPVGRVRSPFDDKFGVPRQAGLAPSAEGSIELLPPFDEPSMLEGLEGFSHLWLTFVFDRCVDQGWRARVRPPRLGGNREIGVWASRSPFRPNHLGLSAVRLLEIVYQPQVLLRVAGLDLVDGTPVVDIKPYLPYADAIDDAEGGFAARAPQADTAVGFSAQAENDLRNVPDSAAFRRLIEEILALDPRPAYQRGEQTRRLYGVLLHGRNVRWRVVDDAIEVVEIG